jgi:hypothetical protein
MRKFMEQFRESKQKLDLALLGSLFGMPVGASAALMFGLMTGRSWERDLVLSAAGALMMGGTLFAVLYLHMLGQHKTGLPGRN